jgi:hypothetical protein
VFVFGKPIASLRQVPALPAYKTLVVVTEINKRSSLQQFEINYDHKKFHDTNPGFVGGGMFFARCKK